MIILLLINILELLTIACLLWTLFEQIMKNANMKDSHDNAMSCLEKAEKERNYWRDEYYRSTSEVKANLLKQNDKYIEQINKIREIAKTSSDLPCADYWGNCEKYNDDITNNGEKCMRKGLKRILKVIEGNLDE